MEGGQAVSDKVPDSIVLAAMAVANWFNSQSLSPNLGWEFMNICSRNHADRLKELERELNTLTKERDIESERATHYRDKWQSAQVRIKRLEEAVETSIRAMEFYGPTSNIADSCKLLKLEMIKAKEAKP
jgi:hypothetical protein